MHLMILGAAGMIGRKLVQKVESTGMLGDHPVSELTLADVVAPEEPKGFTGAVRRCLTTDLSDPKSAPALIAHRPDVIVHLAAIVSGEAERDFDKGYAINMDGTRNLLEAIRAAGQDSPYCPRLVYASSIAVFGAPFPEKIDDTFFLTPRTSYGTQKAIGELLLDDYSRRGFVDGVGLRLPTICIRPGKPNAAASGFFSGILREPLAGQTAVLPVGEDVRHWHASPRSAVGFILHAATMDTARLGFRRCMNMPGVSATVGEQIEALRRVAGDAAVERIERRPDPEIDAIVEGWPRDFDVKRSVELGFVAETSFDEIIRVHIEDELDGRIA